MVLKQCARLPKQPMVLLYMVQEGLANGFQTMYGGDVAMFVPNKIKNNKKYYMSAIIILNINNNKIICGP